MVELTSDIYRVSPRAVMSEVARSWFVKYWWTVALPLTAVVIWACSDSRAFYIGLMFLFVVYPMVLSIVWLKYAFSPRMLNAIKPQRLCLGEHTISVEYVHDDGHTAITPSLVIERNDITAITVKQKRQYTKIVYGRHLDCLILADNDAFSDEMSEALYKMTIATTGNLDSF